MEDKFKLLTKNIMQFSQQGDITKARDEYERLISYQTQKVTDNPESCEEKARLGSSLAIITYIDDQLAVDKKLLLLGEGINLFEDIMSKSVNNLEPDYQLLFLGLLIFRGKTLSDNKNFDSAIEDFNEVIKLSRELKGNFEPTVKGNLASAYVLRSKALYKHSRMTANFLPKDVANTCLNDVNEAISILELIKKSSPEVFNAETWCSDLSFKDLLPKWYKLREGLKPWSGTEKSLASHTETSVAGVNLGYPVYSFMEYRNHYKEDWPGGVKHDHFHFFTDKHFVFELNDGSAHHLNFSDVAYISWAAVGGFFTHELICGFIHTSAGTLVNILISTPGQHMLRDSGLALPNIDIKVGVHLDKEYKEKAKREGKEWKKNLIKKLETAM